jgi:NADH dehydrogenase [ubiquinone] 1 alpha subcomplex assembly factor 7
VNKLGQRIARLIEAQGPLSVAQFMTLALQDPNNGYYTTRDPFGVAGDFTTAPEISQMFGELLGLWIVQCWLDAGKPKARFVELGPGRGTLMADALRAAKVAPEFLSSAEVVLVETSPALVSVQKETLKDCGAIVRWAKQLDEAVSDRPLFLLANEFFDALPVHQFVKTERGWHERMVALENDELAFALSPDIIALPDGPAEAPVGGFYEISPASLAITQRIAQTIATKGGAALIVDYGYGNRTGFGETLQAVKQHRFAPVLDAPGTADITAHVDFAVLAKTARDAGATAFGPVEQGNFLKHLGIAQRAEKLAAQNPAARDTIASAVARLTEPSQMGALFKALAIMPSNAPTPPGF